ncbi:MAG: prenyltransferase/squalene oxidase repeat-containing protein, partial [Candidatus Thorarchaeota archaeon]
MRRKLADIATISLLLFLSSSVILSGSLIVGGDWEHGVSVNTQTPQDFNEAQALYNESLVQGILSFIDKAQDDGTEVIPSMDMAYYLGMSLAYLENLSYPISYPLEDQLLPFIQTSRNSDGGYGNWEGAKSSVESTYQAFLLLSRYDDLSTITAIDANQTAEFLQGLETIEAGFLPLPHWDAPDVSSTFRSLLILDGLKREFSNLVIDIGNLSTTFLENAYVPPIFATGSSGYSENIGGSAEILASLNALQTYHLLNISDSPHLESVAKFLDSLTAINGGVAGYPGGLATTGYTASAIELYLLLKNQTIFDVDNFVNPDFIADATNYLLANRVAGSGFAASERDETPEYSSTLFALRALVLLQDANLLTASLDLSGVYNFITSGVQPTYGFGDYPGDIPDLSLTSNAILLSSLLGNMSNITSTVDQFIETSYSSSRGGFGFRPGTTARVKYTYYGIRSLRSIGSPLSNAQEIKKFLVDAQNPEGGFGEQPASSLSYLTHTYWAIAGLN